MKIEDYEEISYEEYLKLPQDKGASFKDFETGEEDFFKKAQKFPMCFENDEKRIEIDGTSLSVCDKRDNHHSVFCYDVSFPLLVKAVEKAKEVMNKK